MDNYVITISGEQVSPLGDDDRESFELITEGAYKRARSGRSVISYFDTEAVGADVQSETSFTVETDRVILKRASWLGAEMIFDETEKSLFLYSTPFGTMTMGVRTESIKRELNAKGGDLFIKYSLDLNDMVVTHNSFKINVRGENTKKKNDRKKN